MSAIAAHSNKASGAGFFAMPSLAPNVISRRLSKYIGDSDVDVLTARNAGVDCKAVSWGFRDKGVLIKAGADKIADNIQVLKAGLL